MKVPAVNFNNMTGSRYRAVNSCRQNPQDNTSENNKVLSTNYVYPITFSADTGGQSKLRKLFQYKLPCMYSGVIMIDPKLLTRWIDTGLYERPADNVFSALAPYESSFSGMEKRVLKLLAERSKIHPDKNIKELLKEVEPVYKRDLRKIQSPIFIELTSAAQDLPEDYRQKFDELMVKTDNKINERPTIVPFSSYEFKYILSKINEDIQNSSDIKAKKVMRKLIKESQRFCPVTNEKTLDTQQRVLRLIDVIVRKSVLKDNEKLNKLINVSKLRLMREEIVTPFSRKQFLYDLHKIIDDMPDEKLKDKMFDIAYKLPTSNENFAAYVVKLSSYSGDKILHRIVWPYLASIEHLKPKSEGGDRHSLKNLGAARTVLNSERKSRDFKLWLEDHPETRKNCQKYLDKLITLHNSGVFKQIGIPSSYITEFKDTIYELSDGTLRLDISKLKIEEA